MLGRKCDVEFINCTHNTSQHNTNTNSGVCTLKHRDSIPESAYVPIFSSSYIHTIPNL